MLRSMGYGSFPTGFHPLNQGVAFHVGHEFMPAEISFPPQASRYKGFPEGSCCPCC